MQIVYCNFSHCFLSSLHSADLDVTTAGISIETCLQLQLGEIISCLSYFEGQVVSVLARAIDSLSVPPVIGTGFSNSTFKLDED